MFISYEKRNDKNYSCERKCYRNISHDAWKRRNEPDKITDPDEKEKREKQW